jgi:hypothetical protein
MELRFQMYCMIGSRYLKIRRVGTALDIDLFEHPTEFAGGGQRSCNAWKYAQVGALKPIGAGKDGLADVLRPQGAELPVRANFSGRFRIQ